MEKFKKQSKELIKKNLVYIVLVGALVVCIGLLILVEKIQKPEMETESDSMEIVDVSVNVVYSEEDDDTLYNYVSNPSLLDNKGIAAVHIQDVADAINRALQYKEVYGQKAEIISVTKRGTKVSFVVRVAESDIEVTGEYDKSTGEVKCD